MAGWCQMAKGKRVAGVIACAVLLLAVAVTCLFLTSMPSGKSEATASNTSTASSKGNLPVIKIGVDIKEPFVYIGSDGDYTGIDADIAREACRRAGLEPKFVRISWNDRDELLAKGDVDCLWCGYSWNSRADRYRWSDTYLTTTISVLAKSDDPAQSLTDLDADRSVAVRAGSVSETKLLNGSLGIAGPPLVKVYGSVELSEAAFVKGYADCWMGYTYLLDRLCDQNPGTYRFLDRDTLTIDLGVAFDRDYDGPYLDKLDDAIESMKKDGSIDKIARSYVAQPQKDGEASDGE